MGEKGTDKRSECRDRLLIFSVCMAIVFFGTLPYFSYYLIRAALVVLGLVLVFVLVSLPALLILIVCELADSGNHQRKEETIEQSTPVGGEELKAQSWV
ncbi:MAG TPA: hypothetical protein VMX13_13465 [Sedimentisphaerales bacterium]|nr:hypothetical protein [Sedimentisphaerales bacterium]